MLPEVLSHILWGPVCLPSTHFLTSPPDGEGSGRLHDSDEFRLDHIRWTQSSTVQTIVHTISRRKRLEPVRSAYLAALEAKAQLFGCGDQIISFSLHILIGLIKVGRENLKGITANPKAVSPSASTSQNTFTLTMEEKELAEGDIPYYMFRGFGKNDPNHHEKFLCI